jgi:hypothetical protein
MITLRRATVAGLEGDAPAIQAVRDALQLAIELEHATIPVYLYVMYSLDPVKNAQIVQLIDSVVVDEMLHMVLSANVLNALGGSPEIDKPEFVPQYPGHLPGSVESGLTVHLRPFSMEQLDELIAIEQPEDPLIFPLAAVAGDEHVTIGEFYAKIRAAIVLLGDKAFDASGRNQVPPDLMDGSIVVTNVATATAAIDTIVRQGEGTTTSPLDAAGGEMAHYYRFEEIKHGHLLVALPDPKTPDTAYSYTGEAVPFDDTGVYPVPCDPRAHGFPNGYLPGSAQAQMNDAFNATYTGLLGVLHALVNGDATNARFSAALGIMMSLKSQATGMAAGLARPGLHVGPTFQYQPTNP